MAPPKKKYRFPPKPKSSPKKQRRPAAPSRPARKASGKATPAKPRKASKPKRPRRPQGPARPIVDNPAAKSLAHEIATAILDKKAVDVVLLDVRGMASYADYLVIGSGDTERHVTALADAVHEKLKPQGHHPLSTEGETTGHWVLLDYGDVVAHLFNNDVRAFYDLEGLWADAPSERVHA